MSLEAAEKDAGYIIIFIPTTTAVNEAGIIVGDVKNEIHSVELA